MHPGAIGRARPADSKQMATRPLPPRAAPAASQLQQAVALHQSGRLDEAAALYRAILKQAPGHFDATHLLGVIALQHGQLDEARTLIARALESKPRDATALNNLGTTLLRDGRLEEAREQFERAVKAQPAFAQAQCNLGSVLRQLGRVANAVAPLRRAWAANSKSTEVANLLGAALLETGDARGAVAVFEAATKAQPRDAAAWTHLAVACQSAGNPKRALEAADAALRLQPGSAAALSQRGQALAALGQPAEARAAFEDAIHRDPADPQAQHNLGAFLHSVGHLDEAAARFREALRLDPRFDAAHQGLVDVLVEAGRGDEALSHGAALGGTSVQRLVALATAQFAQGQVEASIETYARAVAMPGATAAAFLGHGNALMANGDAEAAARQYARAVELDPEDAHARFALAISPLRAVYDDAAQMEASRRAFARAIAELDAWCTPARAVAAARVAGVSQPFYLAYHPVDLRPLLAPYGRLLSRLMASVKVPAPSHDQPLAPLRARRLRVGFASAQVREHSVWNAITRGWVHQLDPARFEVTVFHLERTSDAETARARRAAANFVDTPTSLAGWVSAIVDAELDVLVFPEIGMHPLTTRLASMRLAPVQAATWGHPQTTALPTIDVYFSAQALEPPQGAAHYTERMIALPGVGAYMAPLRPTSAPPDFARLGLRADEPLLLCPGTPFKYTPSSDAAWVEIARRLQARGSGRLVFFRSHRAGMTNRLEQRLRRAFAASGVDHDRTVAWIPTLPREQFFGLMKQATLMLDTIGFSGFNTAAQALECDLPVIAFEGEFMRGRLASGPLRLIGLDELVADSIPAFADIALRVVDDDALRLRLKREIAARRARLFEDTASVRAFEDALLEAAGKS